MPSPQENTKIEIVAESIEALVLATVVCTNHTTPHMNAINHENLRNARDVVRKSLAELLKPTLRVVTSAPAERATYPGGIDDMKLG